MLVDHDGEEDLPHAGATRRGSATRRDPSRPGDSCRTELTLWREQRFLPWHERAFSMLLRRLPRSSWLRTLAPLAALLALTVSAASGCEFLAAVDDGILL